MKKVKLALVHACVAFAFLQARGEYRVTASRDYVDRKVYIAETNILTQVEEAKDYTDTSVSNLEERVETELAGKYAKPSTGIPKIDLASDVQASLGKADGAIQGVKKDGTTLTPDANNVVDIPAETKVLEYALPASYFPITFHHYTLDRDFTINGNDELSFTVAGNYIWMRGDAEVGEIAGFDETTRNFKEEGSFDITNLKFNAVAPVYNTSPQLEQKETVYVRGVRVAKEAAVAAGLAGKLGNSGDQTLHGDLTLDDYGAEKTLWFTASTGKVGLGFGGGYDANNQVLWSWPGNLPKQAWTVALISDIYAAVQQIAPAFDATRTSANKYAKNDLCSKDGVVYQCTALGGHYGAWNANNWTAKRVSELFLPLTGGTMSGDLTVNAGLMAVQGVDLGYGLGRDHIDDGGLDLDYDGGSYTYHVNFPSASGTLALLQNLAPDFSASATYAVGQLCVHNNRLYRCTTAITTAEAWTAAHWTEVTVEDVLAVIRSALDDKLSLVTDSQTNKTAITVGSRQANTSVGVASVAEGYDTTASGDYSHAEGDDTTASGICSHAEGSNTEASGAGSHAEGGNTEASGDCSHAEGGNTEASGDCSHAEGKHTTASGDYSHAEGDDTTASGYCSHAEGYRAVTAESGSESSATNPHRTAFAWQGRSGITNRSYYHSHGDGTFNINPIPATNETDVASGFYIGEQSLKQRLDVLAPLASPVFTGTPTAPDIGTNTTSQIATRNYVELSISTNNSAFVNAVLQTSVTSNALEVAGITADSVCSNLVAQLGEDTSTLSDFGTFGTVGTAILGLIAALAALKRSKLNSDSVAVPFSSTATYVVGDHCTYNGALYECVVAKTTASATTPDNDIYDESTAPTNHWKLTDMTTPDATLDITSAGSLRVVSAGGNVLWQQGYDLKTASSATQANETVNKYDFAANATANVSLTLPTPPSGKVGDFVLDVTNPALDTAAFTQSAFSDAATYAVGAEVVYDSKIWRCVTAVSTAGAWTGTTNWEEAWPYFSIAGLSSTLEMVVPKGENLSEILTFAPGTRCELYFTLTSFAVNSHPTWKVVRQDVEVVS